MRDTCPSHYRLACMLPDECVAAHRYSPHTVHGFLLYRIHIARDHWHGLQNGKRAQIYNNKLKYINVCKVMARLLVIPAQTPICLHTTSKGPFVTAIASQGQIMSLLCNKSLFFTPRFILFWIESEI